MALPENVTPIYELTQPSTGNRIKYKPFLVKQEKILLMAINSGEESDIIDAALQMIKECLIPVLDLETLPMYDVEYFFICMRAKSIGDSIEQEFTCNNIVGEIACGNKMNVKITSDEVRLVNEDVLKNNTIMLTDDMGVKMKSPPYSILKKLNSADSEGASSTVFLMNCIDIIFDKDQIYPVKNNTKEELSHFIDGLTKQQFDKLQVYVDSLPYLAIEKNIQCPKCGFDHKIKIKEPMDFF